MKVSFSFISVIFIAVFFFILGYFYYPKWKLQGSEATISWDVSGYYWYLPSTFIYKDLKTMESAPAILSKYAPSPDFQQAYKHSSGNYVLKYSSGLAIVMMPAFISAHILAEQFGYEADGFSRPYQFSLWLWGLIFSIAGIILMRKILLQQFSDTTTGITLIAVALGSNLMEYCTMTNGMTHNYLFTLYALIIWSTIKFYRNPSFFKAALIGMILGIMVLIRPTEIIGAIIPLLWGLQPEWESFKTRLIFIKDHITKYILASLCMVMIGSIQLIYWKYVSGEWLVYSYQDQGFSWLKPHIIDGLFSARAGWLIYSPVMIFSLAGFIHYLKFKSHFLTISIFSLLFLYITFAWDIWWYGGSLGQRALIQAYPILMFPMAAFFQAVSKRNFWLILTTVFGLFFINHNFWLTNQAHKGGLLRAGEMTKAYFSAIYLRKEVPVETIKLLDTKNIYKNNIDQSTILFPIDENDVPIRICLDEKNQFTELYKIELPDKKGWLRLSADFTTPDKEWDTWKMTQLILKYYDQDRELKADIIRVQRILNTNETQNIYLDSKIKKNATHVELFMWNSTSSKPICFENLKLIYHRE